MTVVSGRLADFVVDRRMLVTTALALPIGAQSAAAAWCLLQLIRLVTNLVFYQRWAVDLGRRERSHVTSRARAA
jgi:chloride channel protein, CIC family